MPYSQEQLEIYNVKPSGVVQYNTMQFYNPIVGYKRLLASGPNGPYANRSFSVDGVEHEFECVRADVPDTTTQDPTDVRLGTVKLARAATQMREYMSQISKFAITPEDKVIECVLSIYSSRDTEPMYTRKVYVGSDGISIDENDVNINLEFDNPSKSRFGPFYDITEYTGLQFA